MPLKTEAEVTVTAEQLVTHNVGKPTVHPDGSLTVKLPSHVAKELEELGAVTITTPATSY